MRLRNLVATLAAIMVIGVAAFFGVRLITATWFAKAEEPTGIMPPLDAISAERSQPRFEGELLGIYIAPTLDNPPDGFTKPRDICPAGTSSTVVPWEQAGEMNLELHLPPEYTLISESDNTGTIACGDTVTVARRNYQVRLSTADVIIGRSTLRLEQYDVAANRVHTASFAGREAVVIEPVTPNGLAQRSGVFFPEPFGSTFIAAFSLPLEDLLRLADLVGAVTTQ